MLMIKYYLLIVANPLSDSDAAMAVFQSINRLDKFSRDITLRFIFLAFIQQIKIKLIQPRKGLLE